MLGVEHTELLFAFEYDEYANGGIYISCSTEEGPYADISVWTDITPFLSKNEIVIPFYKLGKELMDKIEAYGFLKVDYDRPVRIGYGEGFIATLTADFEDKIEEINRKWCEQFMN